MTTLPSRPSLRKSERGSVLIIAVIAVLLMSIMLSSLSILGKLEATIGLNYKSQAQAEATAEAGLDWARDQVRGAGASGVGTGFTPWLATNMLTSGPGQSVGPFTFNARIDNDCHTANTASLAIEEPGGCNSTTDKNETAVLTSWAVVGTGKSRVRAWIYIDNPWKHVCANSKNDPGGAFCTSAGNTKGNPTVIPSDPQDPNGPRGFDDLPRPIIGCSRIDPTMHGETLASCAALGNALFSQPAITGYPAYPSPPTSPSLVVMGEDPALTATASTCSGGGQVYFGYFDCALSTPCDSATNNCNGASLRMACVRASDTRLTSDPTHYATPTIVGGVITVGCSALTPPATGMVYINAGTGTATQLTNDIGSPAAPLTIYVMRIATGTDYIDDIVQTQSVKIYGTVVAEGGMSDKNKTDICTGGPVPSPPPAANGCVSAPTGTGVTNYPVYGYPLAVLTYDPKEPYPKVSPQTPQAYTTNFGTPNTTVNGSVYSGGKLTFNPINVNGASVAFNIDLQGTSSTYAYMPTYGLASPPAGFPAGASDPVVMLPKSFLTCNNYNDDSGGATACQ